MTYPLVYLFLNRVSTLLIVLKHLSNENQLILKELSPHPRLLFNYMKAIMNIRSGGFSYPENEAESQAYLADLLERSGLEFTDEMAENFVEVCWNSFPLCLQIKKVAVSILAHTDLKLSVWRSSSYDVSFSHNVQLLVDSLHNFSCFVFSFFLSFAVNPSVAL